ncbi:MAG: hypothetical protein DCO97_18555 [Marivita sp. XM-24bin2]|uniref:FG-GAP repeat domain-containing protein n=1 Tax=Marivita sp. XM-24bin2 TaxID=2133951 RepID=UPI000D796C6B|nr:VCBS repeat-containing protein [Marivita sp. XM-24bin2]PWL33631.1 MAG: hypothetical protein DCO97_18555 [Marivita sp. XM-24bin2]
MFATHSEVAFPPSGLSLVDFNQDGWDDITFCTGPGDPPRFFQNRYGYFEEVDLGIDYSGHGNYIIWIDYDNDGDLDCFGINNNTGAFLANQDSIGQFNDVTASVGLNTLPSAIREGGLAADFNKDGLLDLFRGVYAYTAPNSLLFQNSNHQFVDVSTSSGACDSS